MSEYETPDKIELTWRDTAEDVLSIAWELITLAALPTLITLVTWPGVERIFVDTYLVGTPLYAPLAPIRGGARDVDRTDVHPNFVDQPSRNHGLIRGVLASTPDRPAW